MPYSHIARVIEMPTLRTCKHVGFGSIGLDLKKKLKQYLIIHNKELQQLFKTDIAPDLLQETLYIADKFPKMF